MPDLTITLIDGDPIVVTAQEFLPGLAVTPYIGIDRRPVTDRFSFTHTASGVSINSIPLCATCVEHVRVAVKNSGIDWLAPVVAIKANPAADRLNTAIHYLACGADMAVWWDLRLRLADDPTTPAGEGDRV